MPKIRSWWEENRENQRAQKKMTDNYRKQEKKWNEVGETQRRVRVDKYGEEKKREQEED